MDIKFQTSYDREISNEIVILETSFCKNYKTYAIDKKYELKNRLWKSNTYKLIDGWSID